MITQSDLKEAILECVGQRNPSASTCIKLAAFLTIQRELFGSNEANVMPSLDNATMRSYSYAAPTADQVSYDSGTEFSDAIMDRDSSEWLPVIDELMTVLQTINPRLYNGVMRKLEQ